MSKQPRRKKSKRPGRARAGGAKKKRPAGAPKRPLTADQIIASSDLDLRTLVLLAMGDWSEIADLEWPPASIRRWLEKADVRQVRGMLLTSLQRWHELRRRNEPNE